MVNSRDVIPTVAAGYPADSLLRITRSDTVRQVKSQLSHLIASGGWRNPFLSGSTSALSWQSGFVEVKLTRLRSSHVHAHKA
jgi:hypothetical protein